MDKKIEVEDNVNHKVQISERNNICLNGVKKLESFDNKEFFLESVMGYIVIKGDNLELLKLDTFQGNLSIKGKINSLNYLDSNNKKNNNESMLSKLFK